MKEFKNLYLVAILTLVLTITGCGQASDGGGIDSMSSTEQRKNREDTGQDETPEETEKALQEKIKRVKQDSLAWETKGLDSADMAGLQRLLAKKRELERLHISLD